MMASPKKAGETPVAVGEDLWSPSDLLGYIHLDDNDVMYWGFTHLGGKFEEQNATSWSH